MHRYIVTAEGTRLQKAITDQEESRINSLIPDPINKKVLTNKNGDTRDIIKEVLQTYADSRNQLNQVGKMFQGNTILQTCNNIFNFWKKNVTYKIDPEGVQWIKTPSAFWNEGIDPFGDCKSFSIACAASLHALKLKGAFRFVSFGSNKEAPTHVFVVVKDRGKEIIIDCVWHSFNSTKAYSKNWDYNMTSIYSISGLDTSNGRGVLALDNTNAIGLTDNELDLLSQKMLLETEQIMAARVHGIGSLHDNAYEVEIMGVNNALAELGKMRGIKKFKTQRIINFGPAGAPRKRVPQVSPMLLANDYDDYDDYDEIGLLGGKKRKNAEKIAAGKPVKGKVANKRAQSFITKQTKRNDAGKGISKNGAKVLDKLNVVVNKKKDGILKAITKVVSLPVRLAAQGALKLALPKNAPFFLYLFLPANILSKVPDVVAAKRSKALKAKDSIIKKIGMKETTFTNIVRSGIMNAFGMTPENTLAKWMKDASFVGFVEQALSFAKGASSVLSSSLGIDFANLEQDFAAPEDWGDVSTQIKQDVATAVNDSAPPELMPTDEGFFRTAAPQMQRAAPITDSGYTDGYGVYQSGGYTDANGVHQDDDPEGNGALIKTKVLPSVEVTAPKKEGNNTPLLLGLGLLGFMAMSGSTKSKN